MFEKRPAANGPAVKDEWDPDLLGVIDCALLELAGSGQAARAIHAGQRARGFQLADQAGAIHSLDSFVRNGPLVLSFYRGTWCPYCMLALQSLCEAADTFAAL